MKNINILTIILLSLLACTSYDDGQPTDDEWQTVPMIFDVGIESYGDMSSRATITPKNGMTMYIDFNDGKPWGKAVYNSSKGAWSLTYKNAPTSGSNRTCYVTYYENPESIGDKTAYLTGKTAAFRSSTARYSFNADGNKTITVTAILSPINNRLRFKGTPGIKVSLKGLQYYHEFSTESGGSYLRDTVSLVVGPDDYTEYVYYCDIYKKEITLSHSGNIFKIKDIYSTAIYNINNDKRLSAYMDLPTPSKHSGWTMDGDGPTPVDPYNGHEYVDLGLSVKWATCNVGASKPEDYGDYYAWGETETKSKYVWSTYKWCNGNYNTLTKYCTSSSYGTVDNKTQLDPEDDVAHVKWGGSWRMPTNAEQDELCNTNNCTWTWTTQNGVKGYMGTSKKNGNSIFLPAAGSRFDSSLYNVGSDGGYWSSSLSGSYGSYYLYFYSGNVHWNSYYRYYGFSVRPVCP